MWIAMFSQTGSEIVNLSNRLEVDPDVIISNNTDVDSWHPDIRKSSGAVMWGKHDSLMNTLSYIEPAFITLHGYLRILPENVCQYHEIYNGHPGDIILHPELKGKDPQKKAFDLKLASTGVVLHRVIPEVDCGDIVKAQQHVITETSEEELTSSLKKLQLELWYEFLKDKVG